MPKTIHTMAQAYQDICAGEDPWTALGNFANAWYDYAKDERFALVSEPLGKPGRDTDHSGGMSFAAIGSTRTSMNCTSGSRKRAAKA
jgi:hypothetical protein